MRRMATSQRSRSTSCRATTSASAMRRRLERWEAAMPPVPAKPMRTGMEGIVGGSVGPGGSGDIDEAAGRGGLCGGVDDGGGVERFDGREAWGEALEDGPGEVVYQGDVGV